MHIISYCRIDNFTVLLPHRKKNISLFPSPAGMSVTKLSLGGNSLYMKSLFPPRESLVRHHGWVWDYRKVFLRCTIFPRVMKGSAAYREYIERGPNLLAVVLFGSNSLPLSSITAPSSPLSKSSFALCCLCKLTGD
jgi:hypothetical protein